MAFNTNDPRQEFTATASQTEFVFNFKIFVDEDLKIYQTAEGVTPDDTTDILILTTDYTVAIDGDNGGTVTLTVGATLNDSIVIIRDLAVTRETDYQDGGDLLATVLDNDQDYQTYLIQQGLSTTDRTFSISNSALGVDLELPSPILGDYYLKWNSAGTAIEYGLPSGGGSATEFLDSVFRVMDSADPTKKIAFEATNISAVTTRTLTVQDADGTLGLLEEPQTWTAPQRGTWADANDGVIVMAEAQSFSIVPTGNITINLPSDLSSAGGQTGLIVINASTYTISWGTGWYFENGVAPTFTGIVWFSYGVTASGTEIGCSVHVNDVGAI